MPEFIVPIVEAIGSAVITAGAYEAGVFVIGTAYAIASGSPLLGTCIVSGREALERTDDPA